MNDPDPVLPDREYDLAAEQAIIADLENVDKMKAENARLYGELARMRKFYHDAETESLKLTAAIIIFRDATGTANIQAAADRMFALVQPKRQP